MNVMWERKEGMTGVFDLILVESCKVPFHWGKEGKQLKWDLKVQFKVQAMG